MRLVQWRMKWLIKHITVHQLLLYIDSIVIQNPTLRQAPNRCAACKKAQLDNGIVN